MEPNLKVVVAHPAQQHSYRLAIALERAGTLAGYVTTVYMRPGVLTATAARVLPARWRKKAEGRHCNELPDERVRQVCEVGGLLVLLFHNIPLLKRWYWQVKRVVEDRFGRRVARYAAEIGADAVVCYDGCSTVLFEEVKRLSQGTACIVDMSAANALYLRSVFERDQELKPEFADSLHGWRRIWDPVDSERTAREIAAADCFLCGSEFVRRSLAFSGVASERCEVVHYGVDTSAFPYRERPIKGDGEPVTFVYLGHVSEHKGISWLLEAFDGIDSERAKLVLVGAVNLPEAVVGRCPSNIEFRGSIPHDEVSEILLSADVMLFPSLGDGFPLSIMEGFASGLPVVCSENTGAADCVVEGENGFVVPVQDAGALRNRIEWFLANRIELPRMARRSRELVQSYTWDDYYVNVAAAVARLTEKGKSGSDG